MLFSPNESIEDSAIRLISQGKTTPSDIYETISAEGKKVTERAVYKALHYLVKSYVLVKSGHNLAISQEWIDKVSKSFSGQSSVPLLADGESASYKYKSLINLDAYWKHLTKSIQGQIPEYPVFLYSPYHIWYHVDERSQSQADYFKQFEQQKRYAFFVIGNNSPIEQRFKRDFQNNFLQIDTWDKTAFKENENITVISDYIITTVLSPKLSSNISSLYKNLSTGSDTSNDLKKILESPGKAKIKFEKNKEKAIQLRKKMFKNFYLPQDIKNKYPLFG